MVAGTPRAMGRQLGEAAREEVRGFCAAARPLIRKTVRISDRGIDRIVGESLDYAERYAPEQIDELRGVAEATQLTLADLLLIQVRNQMQPEPDAGCTSFALSEAAVRGLGGASRGGLVAQNWDSDPALQPYTIVLTRRPIGKPAHMNITQAGLIAYIGFNDAGIGVCLNTLPAPARPVGVPHYCTVRKIYEARSLDEAAESVRSAHRAIPANIMMVTPDGPADLEVTVDNVHVLRGNSAGQLTHTNHCRHAELCPINHQFPELIQSHARLSRIDALLAAGVPANGTKGLELVQSWLRDHNDHPQSICRHANDHPAHGFWETVFSTVIEPAEGRMHLSRGTPCDHAYETYALASS